MAGDIIPLVAIVVTFFSLVVIIRTISDNKVKHRLIERGEFTEQAAHTLANMSSSVSSLKWGLILVAIGFGFLLINMFPRMFDDEAALGLLLIAAGVALFAHYFMSPKLAKKE